MTDYDLVGRLRELEATKPGEMGPEWLRPIDCSWAVPVSALAGAAADEIERLRNQLGAAQQHNMDLAEQLRAVNAAAAELPLATSVEAFSGTFNDIKKAIKERSNVE